MSDSVIWLLLVAVILAVQATEPPPGRTDEAPLLGPMGARVVRIGAYIAAGYLALLGLSLLFSASADRNHDLVAGALQLAAGLAALALFRWGSHRVPGLRRLRQQAPISWLAILLFVESLAANLSPATAQNTVTSTVGGGGSSSPSGGGGGGGTTAESLMLGALPFLVVGIAAVGPGVRRSVREAAERLGLWPLRLPWWVAGLVVGIVLVPVGDWVAGLLSGLTSANCAAQQVEVQQAIIGTGRTALEQIGVAVAAGVCEETLFRGALQPRFGILLSSALWASYHLQYTCNGLPSASNLYILLLGFVFGGLRKAGGLWPAIFAHVVYDGVILLGLL